MTSDRTLSPDVEDSSMALDHCSLSSWELQSVYSQSRGRGSWRGMAYQAGDWSYYQGFVGETMTSSLSDLVE